MSIDHDDDDFIDILPVKFGAKARPALLVSVLRMRSSVRVQCNFEPGILAEIGVTRFDIAWSQKKRQFRITARDLGRYEPVRTRLGGRELLRCPLPPGFDAADTVIDPEFYVHREMKTITIEIEDSFKPRAVPPPAPSQRDIIERAKAAVPAPKFGRVV